MAEARNVPRLAAAIILLLSPLSAAAHPTEKVYRIGWLSVSAINHDFIQKMGELGYREGRNLSLEYRRAARPRDFPRLAKELVRLKVDLILAVGVAATAAAKQATSTIPIVMGNSSADPVRYGLIDSLAHPGGNVTGVIDRLSDLARKRLEILKEIFPKLLRIAHTAPGGTAAKADLERTEAAARILGVHVQALTLQGPDALVGAFRAAHDAGAQAAVVVGVGFFIRHRRQIVNLAARYDLPTIYTHQRWVEQGGLISYTTDGAARYRRAAEYVDKIFKGAKPADLPVEQPTKYLLEVNLKTAKALGISIPRTLLVRADRMIR